ncbi:uncharacterized protein ACIBXB_000368 [Morphnus guianensis]
MGNILRLSRDKQRDLQLKLALVQSIAEVSCAIQAVGDCGSFELSLKQEATRTLLVSVRSWSRHTGEFWAAPSDWFPQRHDGLSASRELLELCPELVGPLGAGPGWLWLRSRVPPAVPLGFRGGDGAASAQAWQQSLSPGRREGCPVSLPAANSALVSGTCRTG